MVRRVSQRLLKTFRQLTSRNAAVVSKQSTAPQKTQTVVSKTKTEKTVAAFSTVKSNLQSIFEYILHGVAETLVGFLRFSLKLIFWLVLIAVIGEVLGGHSNSLSYQTHVLQSQEDTQDQIAVIRMQGTILKRANEFGTSISAEDYMDLMDYLRKQDEVKGVLLVIDSPGGEVYATDELYRSIRRLSNKKPVYVYAETTLASGAYYIAMGAKKVYVNDLTAVGSIGVVVEFVNYDGLLDKLGIKVRRMTNTGGRFKTGDGLFDNNPNGEEDRLMQRLIDVAYERFLSIVAKSRQLPMERVRSIADGRVMPAVDAKEYGLVDKITTLAETLRDLKDIIGSDKINVVEYKIKGSFIPFLSALESAYSVIMRKTELPGFRLLYLLR